jgi:hypothetical protein
MHSLFKEEANVILGVSVHVPNVIEVVNAWHEIVFELVKLLVNFFFEFFQGKVQIDMIEAIRMVDLIGVDELGELRLPFFHGYQL